MEHLREYLVASHDLARELVLESGPHQFSRVHCAEGAADEASEAAGGDGTEQPRVVPASGKCEKRLCVQVHRQRRPWPSRSRACERRYAGERLTGHRR